MILYKNLPYWGSKNGKYIEALFSILPEQKLSHIVEPCMGSGAFSSNLSAGFDNVKCTAIEIDKSLCCLHGYIQNQPYQLLKELQKIEYSKEYYDSATLKVIEFNKGNVNYTTLDIAVAEYTILVMSINSMRTAYRNLESYKKYTDTEKRRKSKYTLQHLEHSIYRDMGKIVIGNHYAWKNLNIINGDFFSYPQFWQEGKDTLIICDPPYDLSKRGAQKKKRNTGYMYDWNDDMQTKFLDFVEDMQLKDSHSRIIICSNFELDKDGSLRGLQDDRYNQRLLSIGFRLVVLQKKTSSEIRHNKASNTPKKIKAEVVYINYKDILGRWEDVQFYDYENIKKS